MLKPNPNCKVCKAIDKHPTLTKEIYSTTWFVKTSRRTISDVQRKYQAEFTYESIARHVHNGHQTLTPQQIRTKNTKALAERKDKVTKAEKTKATVVWDSVIGEGMRKLQEGEMELKVADLLKATKDKSDYEFKVKDQELQMAEMVAYFASGEGDIKESSKYDRRFVEGETAEDYDPTTEPTSDSDRRTDQSRAFYQSLIGDAASPRSD